VLKLTSSVSPKNSATSPGSARPTGMPTRMCASLHGNRSASRGQGGLPFSPQRASWPSTTPGSYCSSGAAIPASGPSRWESRNSARPPLSARSGRPGGDRRAHPDHRHPRRLLRPGHIVAYTDGEISQEWELILLGRPVTGALAANDEASDVRWVAAADLESLDIHPTQWRQLRDWLNGSGPHVD